jgi:hypothetical protein
VTNCPTGFSPSGSACVASCGSGLFYDPDEIGLDKCVPDCKVQPINKLSVGNVCVMTCPEHLPVYGTDKACKGACDAS